MENPTPQTTLPPSKVKLMCSYNGKIHPRISNTIQLTYTGGDTKLLKVSRTIKLPELISKLSSLCNIAPDFSLKYQLPGWDLDALILIINDDDVDHMMLEYDRLLLDPTKPARIRLFLFNVTEISVSGLNLNPDFLFGFDKEVEDKENAEPISDLGFSGSADNESFVTNAKFLYRVPLRVDGSDGGYYMFPGGVNWEQPVYGGNSKLSDEVTSKGNEKKV